MYPFDLKQLFYEGHFAHWENHRYEEWIFAIPPHGHDMAPTHITYELEWQL